MALFLASRAGRALLAACASFALATPAASQPRAPSDSAPSNFAARILASHNAERRASGLRELAWDERLAAAAARYAEEMAASGEWRHSHEETRTDQGENLWMGTRAAYSLEEMVDEWIVEKRLFQTGRFPEVSKSGNWADVAHYTQLIWPATHRVGCAIGSSRRWDYLVCRYTEPGNVYGEVIANRAPSQSVSAGLAGSSPAIGSSGGTRVASKPQAFAFQVAKE